MTVKKQIETFMKNKGLSLPEQERKNQDDVDVFEIDGKEVIGFKYEYDPAISGYHMYPEYVKVVYPLHHKDGSPVLDEHGKPKLQCKRIEIDSFKDEHIKAYWDYCIDNNSSWVVYRVIKGVSRKLVACDCVKDRPDLIEAQIFNKEITAVGFKDIEEQQRNPNRRYNGFDERNEKGKVIKQSITHKWCVKYDKWPVFIALKEHAAMSVAE